MPAAAAVEILEQTHEGDWSKVELELGFQILPPLEAWTLRFPWYLQANKSYCSAQHLEFKLLRGCPFQKISWTLVMNLNRRIQKYRVGLQTYVNAATLRRSGDTPMMPMNPR